MASSAETPTLDNLKSAPWLQHPALVRVMSALNADAGQTRIIGGAVRNGLLGEPVADIDLATVLLPEQVMSQATKGGLATYPTGIDHGTVTVVADGKSFEVTTLRRDVETDGRHAVVAFTSDWHEDAQRRDFTINALSADAEGNVFDTVGGIEDLKRRRVRFIGEAESRIREDYLRILRFFRFTSAYAKGDPDLQGLVATTQLKDGLQRLSAERIGVEIMKLVVTPRAGDIAAIMQSAGILNALVPLAAHPERLIRLQKIEEALGERPDAIVRLAALFLTTSNDAAMLAQQFRLSTTERTALVEAADDNQAYQPIASEQAAKAQIYRVGTPAFCSAVRVAWARSGASATDASWNERCRLAATWSPPKMPFSGADVMALGLPSGPRIGRTLRAFEDWWIDAGFPADPAVQKAKLADIAGES